MFLPTVALVRLVLVLLRSPGIMLKFKKMGSDKVPLLLVTANVGSIFEDVSTCTGFSITTDIGNGANPDQCVRN